jgi:hypothetical protein
MRYTDRLQNHYRLIRTCLAGEDDVKASGQLYTPKPSAMTTDQYAAYLARAHYIGAPAMTQRALAGIALRKDPVVALPPRLEALRLSATDDQAPLAILIEDVLREVLAFGRVGLLLDFPSTGTTATSLPHFAMFKAETVEEFETAFVNGKKVLTSVHLKSDERFDNSDAHYHLYLEDTIYKFRRFILDDQQDRVNIGEEVIPTVGGKALNAIPFILVSHEGIRPEDVTPPFLALCRTALAHFATSADLRHSLHLTAAPTPYISGSVPANKVPSSIGAGSLWLLPENCQVGMLEFSGAGVSAMREELTNLERVMASQGARMLSASVNRNEEIATATQRTRSELALLHGSVVSTEAALNALLRIAAEWVGASPDEAKVTMSRDFIEVALDPKAAEVQMRLWQAGAISRQTLYENLQQGEIARADRTYEEELTLIENDEGDLSPVVPMPGLLTA